MDASSKVVLTNEKVNLIPYYAWAHRGKGEMEVWVPEKANAARVKQPPTIASTSTVTGSRPAATLKALNDQMEPANSNDHSIIYYHWWPLRDTVQWVQYDFVKPSSVSSTSVYWFDDSPYGECRIPASWKIFYKDGDTWKPVRNKTPYEINKDKYSLLSFEPVTTSALRIEVTLPEKFSTGMLEWKVE
jgi:hypothetical protein